ncbi:MAG: YciI family protein [Helicobacter sp.]|nr:YciI family protein [Helicobacter sp.]
MKNLFLMLVTYTQPIEVIDEILADHREFLKQGYKEGKLLVSGPQEPREGGVIIGCFKDKQEAIDFSKKDPFSLKNAATYQIFEFNPVLHQDFLSDFLS